MPINRDILLTVFFAAVAASAGAAPATRLFAGGSWAAVDRGAVCEAGTRSEKIAVKGKVQAMAGFAFSADRRRWGEFYVRLSRPSRPGSTVILTVDQMPGARTKPITTGVVIGYDSLFYIQFLNPFLKPLNIS